MAIHKFIDFLAQRGHIFQYANKNSSILSILSTLKIIESSHAGGSRGVRLRIFSRVLLGSPNNHQFVWVPGWFLLKKLSFGHPLFHSQQQGGHHRRGVWILFCWPPWRSLGHDRPRFGAIFLRSQKRRMEGPDVAESCKCWESWFLLIFWLFCVFLKHVMLCYLMLTYFETWYLKKKHAMIGMFWMFFPYVSVNKNCDAFDHDPSIWWPAPSPSETVSRRHQQLVPPKKICDFLRCFFPQLFPDTQWMVCLPTFTPQNYQNVDKYMPYIQQLGSSKICRTGFFLGQEWHIYLHRYIKDQPTVCKSTIYGMLVTSKWWV